MADTQVAVVTGDVTVDWNLAHIPTEGDTGADWTEDAQTRACGQRGGAALLADLLQTAAGGLPDDAPRWEVRKPTAPPIPSRPGAPGYHHSYAMWALYENPKERKSAWRVKQFLGLHRIDLTPQDEAARVVVNDAADAPLVVIDDAGLGFRDHRALWPKALFAKEGIGPWIVLKAARPIAHGPLWDFLAAEWADRLIVVMTARDLRRTEVRISKQLSWERTAQDVLWELTHNPRVNSLSRAAHAVVSFGSAGAVLLSRAGGRTVGKLLFDPFLMEEGFEDPRQGGMIGYTATLTVAVAREVMLNPVEPDVARGVRAGVSAMRQLYRAGYGDGAVARECDVVFPLAAVAAEFAQPKPRLAAVDVKDPTDLLAGAPGAAGSDWWTILEAGQTGVLEERAARIVLEGLEAALADVPVGKIGKLQTVDRHEIESLRSVQTLMREYTRHKQPRPLSVAVFGPPGSGKSFGVQQVAESVCPDIRVLTFNLSQFAGPHELHGALHQVRDAALAGKVPLVFWDEFDTPLNDQPLGWLRYFLAPMQDGTFQDGQITHPVGQCLFVFAGGTCARLADFGADLASDEDRKAAKVPDFVSRLKGFLNVLGPNQLPDRPGGDAYFIIRRAILLRSILERNAPHLFERVNGRPHLRIDTGVLRALLTTRLYRHGARSIESIVAMSSLGGKSLFERSGLPSEAQLELHVDGRDFMARVQQLTLDGHLLEQLARAAHSIWLRQRKQERWTYGPKRDNAARIHPLIVPYDDLPEWAKEANRVTVRTIPQKLSAARYVMLPARGGGASPFVFPEKDLERLAEIEHQFWVEAKLAAGFTDGEPTDEEPRRTPYLVPYEQLPDEIKQRDRDMILGMPRILAEAGYTIVSLEADGDGEST